MSPTFFIGSVEIPWYSFMLGLACLLGELLLLWLAKREEIKWDVMLFLALAFLVGGLLGARLAGQIRDSLILGKFVNPAEQKGLVSYGAFLGILIMGWIFARVEQISFWKLLDLVSPPAALGFSISRVGCFLNGCCFGRPTDLPWGVVYPQFSHPWQAYGSVPLHPAQLYAAIGNLILFGILLVLWGRNRFDGFIFLSWGVMYSVLRFVLEIFRADPRIILGLTAAQLGNLVILPVLLVLFWFKGKHAQSQQQTVQDAQ